MAEPGSHCSFSAVIAALVSQGNLPIENKIAVVSVASFVGHFILDSIPHGETKQLWKLFISGLIVSPIILILSFLKGGLELFFLVGLALFFGNLPDGLFFIAMSDKFKENKWARFMLKLNTMTHWFSFKPSKLSWRVNTDCPDLTLYSWRYGWYDIALAATTFTLFIIVL